MAHLQNYSHGNLRETATYRNNAKPEIQLYTKLVKLLDPYPAITKLITTRSHQG